MSNFNVTLDQFSGPLDLMLHLVKDKKLDLFDLQVDVLIDQYILFLDSVENKLDIATEYLYELAALVEYKSKKCLPVDPKPLEVGDYEEDTKDQLVRRLIEYQQFKDISQTLNERFLLRQKQLEKPMEKQILEIAEDENIRFVHADQSDLLKAMQKCLLRFNYSHPNQVRITKTEMSIEDRSEQMILMISTLKEPFFFAAPPVHAFIDTEILVHSPSRYMWAGMGDTYAKYFESTVSSRGEALNHYTQMGVTASKMCYATC